MPNSAKDYEAEIAVIERYLVQAGWGRVAGSPLNSLDNLTDILRAHFPPQAESALKPANPCGLCTAGQAQRETWAQAESAQGEERKLSRSEIFKVLDGWHEHKRGCNWMLRMDQRDDIMATIDKMLSSQPTPSAPSEPGGEEPKTPDIVERLLTACNGHPYAKIAWPHRLLHDAVAEITAFRSRQPQGAPCRGSECEDYGCETCPSSKATKPSAPAQDAPVWELISRLEKLAGIEGEPGHASIILGPDAAAAIERFAASRPTDAALREAMSEAAEHIRAAIALDKKTFEGVGRNTKGHARALILVDEYRADLASAALAASAEKGGEGEA